MNPVVFPYAAWITGVHCCWQSLQVRLAADSSLSPWMLLHIIAVTSGDWQNAKDVTTETTICKKYICMAPTKKPMHYGLQNIIVWKHSSHSPTSHTQPACSVFLIPHHNFWLQFTSFAEFAFHSLLVGCFFYHNQRIFHREYIGQFLKC